jgi:hypothetical protein
MIGMVMVSIATFALTKTDDHASVAAKCAASIQVRPSATVAVNALPIHHELDMR